METVDDDVRHVGVGGDDLMKLDVAFRDEPHSIPALASSLVDRVAIVGKWTVLRVGKVAHVSDLSILFGVLASLEGSCARASCSVVHN